jgi:hypothetical protein
MAIRKLSSVQLGPLEKITLAKAYRIPFWLPNAIETLAADIDKYPIEEIAQSLGWEKAARFASAIARSRSQQNLAHDGVHKDRIICWKCKTALRSAKEVYCPCETRWGGDFCFTVKSIHDDTGQIEEARASLLNDLREIVADENEGV